MGRTKGVITTKVFKSGNSQAVRIPQEFQFSSDIVEIRRKGNELILREPEKTLANVVEILQSFSDDFMKDGRKQPRMQKRKGL